MVAMLSVGCSSGPEPSVQALCERLALVEGMDESLAVADGERLEEQASDLRAAVRVAPQDVAPALRALSETVDTIAATVATATGDRREAVTDALADRQDQIDALTWSGVAVAEWSVANCGLDLDSGSTVTTTTTTPTVDTTPAAGDDSAPTSDP